MIRRGGNVDGLRRGSHPLRRRQSHHVGALIRQSSDTLCLFSSDYPHIEGGRHPLGRFGKILEGVPSASLDRFYCENFARVFGA